MKRRIFMLIMIMLFCISGCNQKKSETVGTQSNNEAVEPKNLSPSENAYNHSAESIDGFFEWWNGPESKTVNNGAFKRLVELYNDIGYILCPSVEGERVKNVFVDSGVDYINFVFSEIGIRVCIEPLNAEENKDFDSTNIKKFMVEKFDMKLNQKQGIKNELSQNEEIQLEQTQTGYEFDTCLYTEKKVKIGGQETECILKTKENQKDNTEHILTFIKDGMLVRIIYYDTKEKKFDVELLKAVSFSKKELK